MEIDNLIVNESDTLKDVMSTLDAVSVGVVFLVGENGRLVRTVTDGDIRRLIISGIELTASIGCFEHSAPICLQEDFTESEAIALLDANEIDALPIVNNDGKPVSLFHRRDITKRIQLSTPHMGTFERSYVEDAFNSNWIAPLGPNVDAFENELADYVDVKSAAALSSGTAAIHLGLIMLGVSRGDRVICSSFTFVASANPILYLGAEPVFIDSEPGTWNMSPQALERALELSKKAGNMPKAIIVAHLYGQSADMGQILALAKKYGVPVLEDAAESLGATCKGKQTGTLGDIGIFSFNGNKIITTSGGGMLVSNNEEYAERAKFLSTQARENAPYYLHESIGYNYRMSNVLAGIGRGQLKVLSERIDARRAVFEKYRDSLSDIKGLNWGPEPEGDFSNRWLTVVQLTEEANTSPEKLISALGELNIEARHVWNPMHKQPLFKGVEYHQHTSEESYCDRLFSSALCLPSATNMTDKEQNKVIDSIRRILTA